MRELLERPGRRLFRYRLDDEAYNLIARVVKDYIAETVAAVMRTVGGQLGNTPAVARAPYVSPAVVEQYLDGRTIDDFRPRHLRVVRARETGLDLEEQALVSVLRSWRIRRARNAA
jgi:DNA topoisomerase IB